jgi:hypothetical protein
MQEQPTRSVLEASIWQAIVLFHIRVYSFRESSSSIPTKDATRDIVMQPYIKKTDIITSDITFEMNYIYIVLQEI